MAAIADCAKVTKTLGNGKGSDEMQQLFRLSEREIQHNTPIEATPTKTSSDPSVSRVPLNINNNKPRQTESMTHPNQQFSTVSTPVVPRVEQSTAAKQKIRKDNHMAKKAAISTTALEHSTRSRTQKTETPPSIRTRANISLTRIENKKLTGRASSVDAKTKRHMQQITNHIAQLDNDFHKALAVMDEYTGNILNYRQLMRKPKYKKKWSTSSANEFRRLAI